MSSQYRTIDPPKAGTYPKYHDGYFEHVAPGNVLENLRHQIDQLNNLVGGLSDSQGNFRYKPEKWSIKQLLGHLVDIERVFAYRALCMARNETAPLPGIEQDDYVDAANFDTRSLTDILSEFALLRRATLALLATLDDDCWDRTGVADGNPHIVRGIPFFLAGHTAWHLKVLRERYLSRLQP